MWSYFMAECPAIRICRQNPACGFHIMPPRSKYQVTPVEVTPEGLWKVPLGSLPATGPIGTMWQRLSQAMRALPPAKALERLLSRPVDMMLTFVRGKGGDDGSLHSLGNALAIPVMGSPLSASQQMSNKYLSNTVLGAITSVPYTRYFRGNLPADEVVRDIEKQFPTAFFIKPAHQEGSIGIEHVTSPAHVGDAVARARAHGDIVVQEREGGQEFSLTLFEDERGNVQVLPPTIIVPKTAGFYDAMAKRRSGRVTLHTPHTPDNLVIAEAEVIARDIWNELGLRGMVSFDMMAGDTAVETLEVNTVPTFTSLTPVVHQLKTAGVHPTRLFDSLIKRSLNGYV